MSRKNVVAKYEELYKEGKDRQNSLEQYSEFFSNFFEDLSLKELIGWMVKEKNKIKVLDVGCGNAGFLFDLKQRFDGNVFTCGIDLIEFEKADKKIIGDALEEDWGKDFDLIVSFRALHEVGNVEKIVSKTIDSLKKGGMAILSFRVQDFFGGKLSFLGEMKDEDARFLQQIGKNGEFNGALIESVESFKELAGVKFLNGVTITLEKPS